jgi:cardiolipin synthase
MRDTFTSHAIENILRHRFSRATYVQLLLRGEETFKTIFEVVGTAKRFICLQFYIFRNDETGKELAEVLKERSQAGVSIYVLHDHFGSFRTPRRFWYEMKKKGIRIRASHPFKWRTPYNYVHRDHRKLIVIDGRIALTGGLNIANEYSGLQRRMRDKVWRDTGILLEGPICEDLFEIFKTSWYTWGGEEIRSGKMDETTSYKEQLEDPSIHLADPLRSLHDVRAIPIFAYSLPGRTRMRRLLNYSFEHAQKSVSLTTAYFIPSLRMVNALEGAVKRGVRVSLLVPGKSDVPPAAIAGRAFFARLLRAGVEIYTYMGEMLHAKTYVFDRYWCLIGSTNLDYQSMVYNDEGNVGILDRAFGSKMAEIFENDLNHSIGIDGKTWDKRPIAQKMEEHFFGLFRKRL